jgi:cullin 3
VERRLEEEMERVKHYLDPGTETKIKEVVETELIFNHMKTLVEMQGSGLINMLEDNKIEGTHKRGKKNRRGGLYVVEEGEKKSNLLLLDLARMYSLLGRVAKGHEFMRNVLGNYVKEIGKAAVSDPSNKENAYVSALLQLKEKYDLILLNAFVNDKAFQRTLNNVSHCCSLCRLALSLLPPSVTS